MTIDEDQKFDRSHGFELESLWATPSSKEDRLIRDAVFGRNEAEFAEIVRYEEFRHGRDPNNPFIGRRLPLSTATVATADARSRSSDFLTVREFQRAYDAVMALNKRGVLFNQSLTISFHLMGRTDDASAQKAFQGIMNDFRGWCDRCGITKHFVFVFERSVEKGIHCHGLIHVPPALRGEFYSAMEKWVDRRTVARAAGIADLLGKRLQITKRATESEIAQRISFDYMMKGLRPDEKVWSKNAFGKRTHVPVSGLLKLRSGYRRPGFLTIKRLRISETLSEASLRDAGFDSGLKLASGIGIDTMWQLDECHFDRRKLAARLSRRLMKADLAQLARLEI